MTFTITNLATGETVDLKRTVAFEHPAWVHAQLETSSEGELQNVLDIYAAQDYYDENGQHKGADACGVCVYEEH